MQFQSVIGHSAIKERMIATALQGRISHAQILLEHEGAGALPLALAYAQFVNCEQATPTDSCGHCASCIKYQKLSHPDLHFVFPVANSAKIKGDAISDSFLPAWREICGQSPYFTYNQWLEQIGTENKQASISKNESSEIIKKLGYKTYEAKYKVMVIWLVEKMNEVCANKLLKILEEPPPATLFLLISQNTEQILQTILSRVQLTRVPRIDKETIAAVLEQQMGCESARARAIAHNAEGSFARAIQLANSDSEGEYFESFTSFMRLCYAKKVPDLMSWSEQAAQLGRERQKAFLEYGLKMLRENFILNNKLEQATYLYGKESDFSMKFSAFISAKNIAPLTKDFNEAHYHIERNGNAKIIFFDLALKTIMNIKLAV